MSVTEYRDRFIELSHYAPEEVADDPKKQERFMEGLAGPLRYQLTSHTFPSFQRLLDKAITLEAMRIELGNLKRKSTTSAQFGSSTRPRFIPPRGTTPNVGGSGGNSGQNQFQQNNQPFKHPIQELRHSTPQTPHPNDQQTSQNTPAGTPVRPSAQVLLLVIHALSVERLVTMLTTVPRGASRIPQCRVSRWGMETRPRKALRDSRAPHMVDWTT
jgi:hypothetical protein